MTSSHLRDHAQTPIPLPPPTASAPPSGDRHQDEPPDDFEAFLAAAYKERALWIRKLKLGPKGEDLLQEAFLQLFLHRDNIPAKARWSWLSTALDYRRLHLTRSRECWKKYAPRIEAHHEGIPSPFAPPDATLWCDQVHTAAVWLVNQVEPSRRDVAKQYVWGDKTLDEIAEKEGVPPATVASQWHRAIEDMRAALDREKAKAERDPWLVLAVVLFAHLKLWLLGRIRSITEPIASSAAHVASALSGLVRRGSERRRSVSRKRSRVVLVLAIASLCASFSAALLHRDPLEIPASSDVDEIRSAMFAGSDLSTFMPYLATNAEREREWGSPSEAPSSASLTHSRAAHRTPIAPPKPDAAHDAPRKLLAQTAAAMMRGDASSARALLRLYEQSYPEDPWPAQHAKVAASLGAP